MSKWNLTFVAIAAFTVASQTIATAQIQQRSLAQPTPLVPTSTPESAKRRLPSPGTGDTPVLKSPIRINPIQMYNLGGKPFLADTADGQVYYLYEGENLVEEHIGHGDDMITGRYTYGRDGRFEALTYSDGITISAKYGNDSELLMLTSGSGRSIGFSYRRNDAGAISVVTPTRNFLEFHSAVALLRLKRPPHWWPNAEPTGRLMDTKNKGGDFTPWDSTTNGRH